MIKYALICTAQHEFDIWFSKSADYDEQTAAGLVICPHCGSRDVEKSIMAPNISTGRRKENIATQQAKLAALADVAASKIRDKIVNDCDDVGDKFADEARAIHYGEKPERGIYGQATPDEASNLIGEGIRVAPLPDVLVPKPKTKLN